MKKYKIGYTTGVFDLFHVGHLNILKKAKSQCEYLIVGVTTDDEVSRVKNKRPIVSFDERIKIVESIKYVDKVVAENNTNKLAAWNDLKFDVIFKGDDWKGTPKWEEYEREFAKRNVSVRYFSYTKGTSSTILREVLLKNLEMQKGDLPSKV
ncbi:cytidyltransferase [Lederbergia ruris]|uniref:Cytidyltransferase n=1 Tax=Lederbergia ruris TaxID=217495 RepID=A0ABQ4KMV7_9BACI|nr:adenylyltransferase/cytidyltransferase family protein [Lederbergia ruris]GIN58831.1 cytidyltransferase [Lederbergia ruris]